MFHSSRESVTEAIYTPNTSFQRTQTARPCGPLNPDR